MKKIFGISLATNIGVWVISATAFLLGLLVDKDCFVIFFGIMGYYAAMIYYFKYEFPYRPFVVTMSGDYLRVGDVIKAASNGTKAIVKKSLGNGSYVVKPIRNKKIK
jgi:hypothetical protein